MADVFVGGFQGFDIFKDPTASRTLRATGRVGLYEHQTGVSTVYDEHAWQAIQSSFAGTGPGYAELPWLTGADLSWFSSGYKALYNGQVYDAAVNTPDAYIDPTAWSAYVSAAKAAGIARVAPIFSPNSGTDPYGNFATMGEYATVRSAALVGGGLAIDAPPHAALIWGPSYIATIDSEVIWARSEGVHSTVILSPHAGDNDFNLLENTVNFVAQLAAANALPDTWVVETYAADGTTLLGTETDPESVAGVGLFMASSNDTAASIASGATSFRWTTPIHFTVGGARRLAVVDSGGQAYVVGGSGGLAMFSTGANDQVWTSAGSTNSLYLGAAAVVHSRGTDVLSVGNGSTVTIDGTATVVGGTGSSAYTLTGSVDITSQATGAGDVIQAAAGSRLNLTASGSLFTLTDNGAAVLHVAETAGADHNIVDVSGHAVLYGGAGAGLNITTTSNAVTQIVLDEGDASIASHGSGDKITGSSGSSSIAVFGSATIASQSAGNDTVLANTGATATVAITGKSANVFENAATLHVTETGGGDNASLDVVGGNAVVYGGAGKGLSVNTTAGVATRLTLNSGPTAILSQGTGDVITGDSASNTINVTGSATIASQSAGNDTVIANTGATATVAITGKSANVFENAATLHVTETGGGDHASMDVSGGNAVVYGGAGKGLSVNTTAGVATRLTLNSGPTAILSQGTGDVITGDSASNTINVTGSATIASQSAGNDTVIANTGATATVAITGKSANVFENAATLHVTETGNGDNASLDVVGGNAVVYGGAGKGLSVNTTAGVATRLTLNSGPTTILSQGTGDVITGDSASNTINVTGSATIASQSAGNDTVIANTGATATVAITGKSANVFENAATLHVTETGNGDNASLDVAGGNAVVYGGAGKGLSVNTTAGVATRLTLNSGPTAILSQGTGDVITGDSASNTINVTGSATIASQSAGNDTVIANTGATATVAITGKSANVFENAATLHVTETGNGDNASLDVVGGNAVVYGGAGKGLSVNTTAGVATRLTLNSGPSAILSQGTGDVITGDSASNTINVTGSATIASQSAGNDTVIANTGATATVAITGKSANVFENAATLHVTETGNGDNASLDVAGGNAVVYGGAGKGLSVNTTAGVATRLTLNSGPTAILSQGTGDVITGDSASNTINVTGSATIASQSAGNDTVIANTGATATVAITGKSANVFENAATLHVTETGGGDHASMDVSGGNAVVYGGAGQGLAVRTTAGVSTTVALGTGDETVVSLGSDTVHGGAGKMNFVGGAGVDTVTGGAGAMTVTAGSGNITLVGSNAGDSFYSGTGFATFTEGSGNNLAVLGMGSALVTGGSGANVYYLEAGTGPRTVEIKNYHPGADTLAYRGFAGNPVASQSVSNGSLTLTLTDGDVVRFDGVTRLS